MQACEEDISCEVTGTKTINNVQAFHGDHVNGNDNGNGVDSDGGYATSANRSGITSEIVNGSTSQRKEHRSEKSEHHGRSVNDRSDRHESAKPKDVHQSSSSKDRHHSSSHGSKSTSSDQKHSSSSSSKSQHNSSSSSSKHQDKSSSSSKHSGSSSSSKHKESRDSRPDGSSKPRPEGHSNSGSRDQSGPRESSKHGDVRASDARNYDEPARSKEGSSGKPRLVESSFLVDNITAGSYRPPAEKRPVKIEASVKNSAESKEIKHEFASPAKVKVDKSGVKDEPEERAASSPEKRKTSDDEDDIPLMNRVSEKSTPASSKRNRDDDDDDDDLPLFSRVHKAKGGSESKLKVKRRHEVDSGDESDVPLVVRAEKVQKTSDKRHSTGNIGKRKREDSDDEFSVKKAKKHKDKGGSKHGSKESPQKGGGRKKKDNAEEEETKWKWWEEGEKDESVKWKSLEHNGVMFAPPYEPLPKSVKFSYDGKHMRLSQDAEEVAGFYGKMLEHEYTTRDLFNRNFFKDWRKVMTKEEREIITELKKCNFREMCEYFKLKSEERKNMSKEQKLAIKKENEEIVKRYGFCIIDGHKQKIGNFRIEPPGLFRGRGEHPKQGMLKKRTVPSDVIINCSKGSKIPSPPPGTKWKEVRHDNTVTWLASWNENIQGATKYVMLNAASKLKGEKDWKKYEVARKLHKHIDRIRAQYQEDLRSKEMGVRQRAVAMYFIDKLALRAGNEKDEDTADTVGCCSLRVEHIQLKPELNGKQYVVVFDFLGKDSIRYYNEVAVEKRVYSSLEHFMKDKESGTDLFDRLNTTILNKHLQNLMDGLSAKVFRTFNASRTLQEQLNLLTDPEDTVNAKLLSYNRANRAVAILCNHQRAAPKNFDKQMENLQSKIDAKKDVVRSAKKELKSAKSDYKACKSVAAKNVVAKKQKALERAEEQLGKLELQATDKDENKEIALGTSKLNYLDPRISVAWCKKWEVPIEKVYNKTQREKFAWAIDMADEDYCF